MRRGLRGFWKAPENSHSFATSLAPATSLWFLLVSYVVTVVMYKSHVHPMTDHEGIEEEYSYCFPLSLTSSLDGGGWSAPLPSRFIPEKETRYSSYKRLGVPQSQSGWMRIVFSPRGLEQSCPRGQSIYRLRCYGE
jgi:hypothetical protein